MHSQGILAGRSLTGEKRPKWLEYHYWFVRSDLNDNLLQFLPFPFVIQVGLKLNEKSS